MVRCEGVVSCVSTAMFRCNSVPGICWKVIVCCDSFVSCEPIAFCEAVLSCEATCFLGSNCMLRRNFSPMKGLPRLNLARTKTKQQRFFFLNIWMYFCVVSFVFCLLVLSYFERTRNKYMDWWQFNFLVRHTGTNTNSKERVGRLALCSSGGWTLILIVNLSKVRQ